MNEKLKGFFNFGELKAFFKKAFSKKVIGVAITAIVLIAALRIGFSLIFQVDGTVMKVDGKNIVVSNFFYTKTVNIGDLQIDTTKIQAGERIRVTKNLSGDVISVRAGYGRFDKGNRGPRQGNFNPGAGPRGIRGKR